MLKKVVKNVVRKQSMKQIQECVDTKKKAMVDKLEYEAKIDKLKLDFEAVKTNIKKRS
jgi:hypothetical protein